MLIGLFNNLLHSHIKDKNLYPHSEAFHFFLQALQKILQGVYKIDMEALI